MTVQSERKFYPKMQFDGGSKQEECILPILRYVLHLGEIEKSTSQLFKKYVLYIIQVKICKHFTYKNGVFIFQPQRITKFYSFLLSNWLCSQKYLRPSLSFNKEWGKVNVTPTLNNLYYFSSVYNYHIVNCSSK